MNKFIEPPWNFISTFREQGTYKHRKFHIATHTHTILTVGLPHSTKSSAIENRRRSLRKRHPVKLCYKKTKIESTRHIKECLLESYMLQDLIEYGGGFT